MEFLDKAIQEYSEKHSSPESDLLLSLSRETYLKVLMPNMLSGHIQGRVLSMISHMVRPKRVLEIGTFTGYSTLCFAEGLEEGGKVITIDVNEELEAMVRKYIDKASLTDKIDFRIGNALEIIPVLQDTFDLVFIDADKENYSAYFDIVIDKVRQGGFILADNVLWSGKVLEPERHGDTETSAIHEFNQKVKADPRVENVLFPIRDGIMVLRKI